MPISDDQTGRTPPDGGDAPETYPGGYSAAEIEGMDHFDAFEAGVNAGESQVRERLTGWFYSSAIRVVDSR